MAADNPELVKLLKRQNIFYTLLFLGIVICGSSCYLLINNVPQLLESGARAHWRKTTFVTLPGVILSGRECQCVKGRCATCFTITANITYTPESFPKTVILSDIQTQNQFEAHAWENHQPSDLWYDPARPEDVVFQSPSAQHSWALFLTALGAVGVPVGIVVGGVFYFLGKRNSKKLKVVKDAAAAETASAAVDAEGQHTTAMQTTKCCNPSCGLMLQHPVGLPSIQCSQCSSMTTVGVVVAQPVAMQNSKCSNTSCGLLLQHPVGLPSIQCSQCNTITALSKSKDETTQQTLEVHDMTETLHDQHSSPQENTNEHSEHTSHPSYTPSLAPEVRTSKPDGSIL